MAQFDDRISRLARGRLTPSRATFPFLGEDIVVGVRLLRDRDVDACRVDAVVWVRSKARDLKMSPHDLLSIDASILDREIERRIIYRAFLDVETIEDGEPRPFFEAPQQVSSLDALTVETLHQLYLEHQNSMDPLHGLEDGEATRFVEALGKAFSDPEGPKVGLVLATYDAATLRRLLLISVALHAKSTGGT